MSITAIVENDTIKLPVHVPNGTTVEISLRTAPGRAANQPPDQPTQPAAVSGWPLLGMLKGKMTIADDFDEPLEEMRPYME